MLKYYRWLLKGKSFPVGTIREWGGKKYRKVGPNDWKEVTTPTPKKSTIGMSEAEARTVWDGLDKDVRMSILNDVKKTVKIKTMAQWVEEGVKYIQTHGVGHAVTTKPDVPVPSVKDDAVRLYKSEGVKSPFFKAWFGNWEKGEGSKVVKKDGSPAENYNTSPIRLFHGTSSGGFTQFDEDAQDPYAIYGKGFYFTEDKEIAEEYSSGKDASAEDLAGKATGYSVNGKPITYLNETGIKKMLATEPTRKTPAQSVFGATERDSQIKNPNWGPQIIAGLEAAYEPGKGYSVAKFLDTYVAAFGEKIKNPHVRSSVNTGKAMFYDMAKQYIPGLEYTLPKPEVFEVYLNIRKPFDCDRVLNKDETNALLQSMGRKVKQTVQYQDIGGWVTKEVERPGFQPYMDDVLSMDEWDEKIRHRVPGRGGPPDPKYSGAGGLDYASPASEFTYEDVIAIRDVMREQTHTEDRDANQYIRGWKRGDPVWPELHRNKSKALTAEEFHYIMTNARKDADDFNQFLRREGYDGIHHTGGLNIGTREHSVWIAFRSEQIKATTNEGTFDPSNKSIMKSRTLFIRTNLGRFPVTW